MADEVAEPFNSLESLEDTDDDRAGHAEGDKVVEVRPAAVLLVERMGLFVIKLQHFEREESKPLLFTDLNDGADMPKLYGIGFEHDKGTFHTASYAVISMAGMR